MHKLKRYLFLSQAHLFGWLIMSSIFASSVVFTNGGVSNYGNHYTTVPFFTLAFILGASYLYLAAETLVQLSKRFRFLSRYLVVLCGIMLLVYITTFPRRFGDVYSDIHDNVSKFLFIYELFLATWLVAKHHTLQSFVFLFIMIGGSFIGLLSSLHVLHLMFVGQMIGALGFGLLLVYILPKVIESQLKKHR
ncbi:MAG: hypothetical protein KIH63_001000 [Candidatus Saccharibacteria bacterium]|nr:hypothetical protein [Candidatus Saccharibacteria bacterium]